MNRPRFQRDDMKTASRILSAWLLAATAWASFAADQPYTVVGTGQTRCYDNRREIAPPKPGEPFYGQDAQHPGVAPSYRDNGNGTVSDLNTGLMWVKARGEKMPWEAAVAGAMVCRVGTHQDWRMPTIKELYSLIQFTGQSQGPTASTPFLDTNYFGFAFGDQSKGERSIDCQDWTATAYLSTTMNGNATVFGVNFADGRIKGYPKVMHRMEASTPTAFTSATFAATRSTAGTIFTTMATGQSRIAPPD